MGDDVSRQQVANAWGLSSPEVVTAWVALSDAPVERAPMRFFPESHPQACGHRGTFARQNLLSGGQEIEVAMDKNKAIQTPLKAGEFSLHHVLLMHRSRPNHSADRRLGFAIRHITAHVGQTASPADSARLGRGIDAYNPFQLDPRPTITNNNPTFDGIFSGRSEEKAHTLFKGSAVMGKSSGRWLECAPLWG